LSQAGDRIGSYYVIDIKNLDEGIEIAARIPTSSFGCVEVRPLMKMRASDALDAE
jgi:hypothetical protein